MPPPLAPADLTSETRKLRRRQNTWVMDVIGDGLCRRFSVG